MRRASRGAFARWIVATAVAALSPRRTSAATLIDEERNARGRRTQAWAELHAGRYKAALAGFEDEYAIWSFDHTTFGFVDALRGMLISAILENRPTVVRKTWATIRSQPSFYEYPADELAFRERWSEAFRSYRDATTNDSIDDPRAGHDPIVSSAVEQFVRGNADGAAHILAQPSVAAPGPNDLGDLQLALIGSIDAMRGKWTSARAAWIAAARYQRNIPQMTYLTPGNITALAMLDHFQARVRA